jgi:hypothetical protein
MHWELWDTDSGNLVGDYATEADALLIVRNAVQRHGPAVAAMLALGAEYDDERGADDEPLPVLRGRELIARANGEPPDEAADSL